MTDPVFPPRSDRAGEIDTLLGALAAAVLTRSAVYVAAPVTTGPRFADWYPRRGGDPGSAAYAAGHQAHVVGPNRAAAAAEVRRLRAAFPGVVVIDPTGLEPPGWGQADYHVFWTAVIARFAHTVVFLDGWEYSGGCAFEFLTAHRRGLAVRAADLSPLAAPAGAALLAAAVGRMRGCGVPAPLPEAVLAELARPPEAVDPP